MLSPLYELRSAPFDHGLPLWSRSPTSIVSHIGYGPPPFTVSPFSGLPSIVKMSYPLVTDAPAGQGLPYSYSPFSTVYPIHSLPLGHGRRPWSPSPLFTISLVGHSLAIGHRLPLWSGVPLQSQCLRLATVSPFGPVSPLVTVSPFVHSHPFGSQCSHLVVLSPSGQGLPCQSQSSQFMANPYVQGLLPLFDFYFILSRS